MTNTKELNKVINDSGYKKMFLADELGISQNYFTKKVNGEIDFKVSEIKKLAKLLHIDENGILNIFFS